MALCLASSVLDSALPSLHTGAVTSSIPTYLANYQAVVQAFGGWPGFHDGYLLAFERRADDFECEIHGWNMTHEIDERGFFVLERHHRVTFHFSGIHDADLSGLDACKSSFGTNIVGDLLLTPPEECSGDGSFEVQFESGVGCEFSGSFRALKGTVVSVRRCGPKGELALVDDLGAETAG